MGDNFLQRRRRGRHSSDGVSSLARYPSFHSPILPFLHQAEALIDHLCCPFKIRCCVVQAEKAGFELGGGEIDASLEAEMEEFAKCGQIRFCRICKTPDRPFCKEKAEHRSDAMKLVTFAEASQDLFDAALYLPAKLFELGPTVDTLQFP